MFYRKKGIREPKFLFARTYYIGNGYCNIDLQYCNTESFVCSSHLMQKKSFVEISTFINLIILAAELFENFNNNFPFFPQRFIMILSEHFLRCDTDGIEFKTAWYRWTVGRLQQVFMMVSSVIQK